MGTSMNIISKMLFGMSLANALLLALADGKLTSAEVVSILQAVLAGLGQSIKIGANDLVFASNDDGSLSVTFSKAIMDHLSFKV